MIHAVPADLPILSLDDEPLGKWKERNGFSAWSGVSQWLVRHGEALVLRSHGQATRAWRVAGPNGEAGTCERISPHAWRFWSEAHVLYGVLTSDLRTFVPSDERYCPPAHGLEAALWNHVDFRALVRQRPFMAAACRYLASNSFREDRADDGRIVFSEHTASAMLSRMRGWGDGPLDMSDASFAYYPHHTIMFEEMLEDIGWHALTPEEFARDHGRAHALLARIDDRRPGSIPSDRRPTAFPLMALSMEGGEHSLSPRLRRAMNEGRCEAEEVILITGLLDYGDERLLADPEFVRRS